VWAINLDQYREFCKNHTAEIPLFYQPWWLDAVCVTGHWLPFVSKDGQSVWPVFIKKKGPFRKITMPPLTARLGPWPIHLAYSSKDTIEIIKKSGFALGFVQHLSGNLSDYTFLKNAGFQLRAFSHYIIQPDNTAAQIAKKMNSLSRRNLQKAALCLDCQPLKNMSVLDNLITRSLARHGEQNPIPLATAERLFKILVEKEQGTAWMAVDQETQIHAAVLLAWDNETIYYLAGGLDDRIPQIGASRFLLWKGIELALQHHKQFDFGGGFVPGVDAVYQSMGGESKTYVRAECSIFGRFRCII
jgi:hypothetical protein